ncbi:MAG TPA: hypothetical protein VJI73_03100 [Candidatus Paceibacterota bacterium]
MGHTSTKITPTRIVELGRKTEVRRDPRWWAVLSGIWSGKDLGDVIKWQRNIRKDRVIIRGKLKL